MPVRHQTIPQDPAFLGEGLNYLGCVDGFDPASGIAGWVVKIGSDSAAVELELLVNGVPTGDRAVSCEPRDDLMTDFPGHSDIAGFIFPVDGWETFKTLVRIRPEANFALRIAGTNLVLPCKPEVPALKEIVTSRVAAVAAATQFDLAGHLSYLSGLAGPLSGARAPGAEIRKGLIEAICLDDHDSRLCWFVGWTAEPELYAEPAMLDAGQDIPAAFSVVTYPRNDVPGGACGFIGVLLSAWQPPADSGLAVYFGPGGSFCLRAVAGLKRVSKAEFAAHIKLVRETSSSARWGDLIELLHGAQSWLPSAESRPDVTVSVDRVFVLPGFGCFASGWVLSALQDVRGFALKIGKAVLTMEASSLYFCPRPDLLSAFPDAGPMVGRAGFCCFFPGDIEVGVMEKPLFKVILEPKGATVHPVELSRFRRIGHSEPIDSLLKLYPAIETEPFFPRLSAFLRRNEQAGAAGLEVLRIAPSRTAMIFALSADRADFLLGIEEIRQNAQARLPADCAMTIIASANRQHGEIIELFDSFDDSLKARCGLVFMRDTDAALYGLQELLLLLGTEQFVFIAAGCYPSAEGWNAAGRFLESDTGDLTVLSAYDPETLHIIESMASCFAWNYEGFLEWLGQAPARLDFAMVTQAANIVEHACFVSKPACRSRLHDLVNRFEHA